eukprot:scaffold74824_cov69-Phaeocystis_antarctica.AAC.2
MPVLRDCVAHAAGHAARQHAARCGAAWACGREVGEEVKVWRPPSTSPTSYSTRAASGERRSETESRYKERSL